MNKGNPQDYLKTPLYWVGQEAQDACVQLDIYLTALEDHMDTVRAQFRLRADRDHEKRLSELDPEKVPPSEYETRKECEYLYKIEKDWYEKSKIGQDKIIMQMAWNSFIVSCWATYEMYFDRLADYVRDKKNIAKTPSQINVGRKKISKNQRLIIYFRDTLHISLLIENDDLEYLENLYSIRNAIAHGNGRIDEVFEDRQEKLVKFISGRQNIIELEGRKLLFGKSFAKEAMAIVTKTLKEINNSVRRDFKYILIR